jgi:hypothetical protein
MTKFIYPELPLRYLVLSIMPLILAIPVPHRGLPFIQQTSQLSLNKHGALIIHPRGIFYLELSS